MSFDPAGSDNHLLGAVKDIVEKKSRAVAQAETEGGRQRIEAQRAQLARRETWLKGVSKDLVGRSSRASKVAPTHG